MSRYLVTGATGFLGSHLAAHLLKHGHEVVALCRRPSPALADLGLVVMAGDILDRDAVSAAAAGCEGVFHCAGKVSRKAEDAELLHRTNVDGTKIVVAASKAAGVKRLVLASTSGTIAISKTPKVWDERAPVPLELIGKWPYYRSKLYAESAALEQLVARSCEIKADIVARDEREGGFRAVLNFGHTLGHAIEKISGFGRVLHGEAGALGMC